MLCKKNVKHMDPLIWCNVFPVGVNNNVNFKEPNPTKLLVNFKYLLFKKSYMNLVEYFLFTPLRVKYFLNN